MAKLKARVTNMLASTTRKGRVRTLCTAHADQPELYHGLPKIRDRHLGKPVEGVETAGSGWLYCHFCRVDFHYIGIGPNKEVDDDEEDHHE